MRELLDALARDRRLSRDADFFCEILRLPREALAQTLLSEAGRFRPGPKSFSILGAAKELQKNEGKYFWSELPRRVLKLAKDIERAERSQLSPSKTIVHCDEEGRPYPQQAEITRTFAALPEILRRWARECGRKSSIARIDYMLQRKDQDELIEHAKKTGIEERIYAATGKYHLDRLLRLLETAAGLLGLVLINKRALVIRLNLQRKRFHGSSASRLPAIS